MRLCAVLCAGGNREAGRGEGGLPGCSFCSGLPARGPARTGFALGMGVAGRRGEERRSNQGRATLARA